MPIRIFQIAPIVRITSASLAVLLLAAAVQAKAQQLDVQPQVANAELSTKPAGDSLLKTISALGQASSKPLWVGYRILTDSPFQTWSSPSNLVHLEQPGADDNRYRDHAGNSVSEALILLRVADGAVGSLRLAQPADHLDARGLRFVVLTGVSSEKSIAFLKDLATTASASRNRKDAVFFISLHRSPAAVPTLAELAAPGQLPEIREAAAFWLANQRGHDGFVAVQTLARQDSDAAFRKKLAFDLTLSHDPGALPELIRMAHQDASPGVREQAQFWMAQQAGKHASQQSSQQVTTALRHAADGGPDAHAREQAVFAISRLPDSQATPQLEDLVRTSRYPEVRKQAVFWLGQSHDPAALDFITSLLLQPANPAR